MTNMDHPKAATEFIAGARIFRYQIDGDLPGGVRDEFAASFAGSRLSDIGKAALNLLSHTETTSALSQADLPAGMNPTKLGRKLLNVESVTTGTVLLSQQVMGFEARPTGNGLDYKFSIFLADTNGTLVEEREVYLEALQKITGWRPAETDYTPSITLGRTYRGDASLLPTAEIDFLRPFVPDKVALNKVMALPYPYPRNIPEQR